MATLEENIKQAISDFDDIKAAIEERGVNVPAGTDTRKYGDLIRSILAAEDYLAMVWNKEITELVNYKMKGTLSANFQQNNTALVKIDLPLITKLASAVFSGCNNLVDVNLPAVTEISANAFSNCWYLKSITLPSLITFVDWGYSFNICYSLETVVLPVFTGEITVVCFGGCKKLSTLVLGADTVCSLKSTNAFPSETPIAKGTGWIYVRKHLVEEYKADTNWSAFANQILAIEDYPEIVALLPSVTFALQTVDMDTGDLYFEEYTASYGTTWGEWAQANGYIVIESGAIMNNNGFFLVPYGAYDYDAIKATDVIQEGQYWFA